MILDLSLNNKELYEGCEIIEVGGRLTLKTPPEVAKEIIGANTKSIVEKATDRSIVTLTGAMAVYSYLVVFHMVVHSFKEVYYNDGRGSNILVSAHY